VAFDRRKGKGGGRRGRCHVEERRGEGPGSVMPRRGGRRGVLAGSAPAGARGGRPAHTRAGEWGGVCGLRVGRAGGGRRSWVEPERTMPILI
jgi:hypothetical protein